MDTSINQTIKGYELRDHIGAGGFGAVYRAYQTTVGREVAVKIILPGLANQPEFIRRFEGEAQLVARLEHPHITPLYDYWRDMEGAYLVMRWLRGGSLRDALESGPFELHAAALLLDQVVGALSLAHRNGVIHRDIKPGNILLDEDGNAYLTDFGIAKDLNLPSNNTQQDAIVGSLDYISPEQARSEPVTARTDIYSLGVTIFEVITGRHPFDNISPVERLYKHINDPLPDITSLEPGLQAEVNRVIQKATAKNPEYRYSDAMMLAADFREALGMNRMSTTVVELLTQREHEILQLMIEGLSNKDIAQRLTVTVGTIKWYVNQIFSKMGVRSRVQAIVRARELNLIVKAGEALSAAPISTEDFRPENPYKGLRAFQSADNQDFFGREKVTSKLIQRMGETSEYSRFLAVVGPSGSGKSSLVKAGLIPALWRGDLHKSEKWFVVEMLPGSHPLDELEIALTKVAANQAPNMREHLERDSRGLLRVAQLILPNDGSELVLVIDQFEEVFTLVEDEAARSHFLDLLYSAVTEPRSRVRVVVTLRADFYDRPLLYPYFGELVRTRLETIMPLSAEELEKAITNPAQRVGVTFEPGLVAGIIADVNYQPGALPLLQYALTELFEQRRGRILTREAYQSLGGTTGALARRTEEVYLSLDETEQEAARQMFLRLVTLGEGVEDTRRRTMRSELQATAADMDMIDDIIDTFASYRLLSLDTEPGTHAPTVEVAHEALLREWERLRAWLNESRDEIKLQRQLSSMAQEWQRANQDASFLARGNRLAQFETWANETKLALTGAEYAFLDASSTQHAQEQKAEAERKAHEIQLERRSQNFLRGLVAVLVVAALVGFGLAALAINQSQIAQQNAELADRNAAELQNVALVAGSQAALANGNTDEAIALALQAVTLDPNSARAQVALNEAAYTPGTSRRLATGAASVKFSSDGHTILLGQGNEGMLLLDIATGKTIRKFEGDIGFVEHVALSPDEHTALAASDDKTLILFDAATGKIIRRFTGHTDGLKGVAFSPDGRTALSSGYDHTIILWDIESGALIRRFEGHTDAVRTVAFSPDGRTALSGSTDKTLILWDIQTRNIIQHFQGHSAGVLSVAFSPDGHTALSGGADSVMILWDIKTGQELRRYYSSQNWVQDVAFSPDGHTALSGGLDGTVIFWDVQTAQPISYLRGHTDQVTGVAFSPDGRTALSSSPSELRLWDLNRGQIVRRFPNQQNGVWNVARSPDGHTALSSSNDGSVILWNIQTSQEIRRYLSTDQISGVAYSPDGHTALIATGLFGGKASDVILWDLRTGQEIRHLVGHPGGVTAVAFSPDGRMAVSGGVEGAIILWNVATGREIRRFKGYENSEFRYPPAIVTSVAFNPDARRILTQFVDDKIVLWDVATGQEIRKFAGQGGGLGIVFSPDGQSAFSGSFDHTTILWNVETGAISHRFSDHDGIVNQVQISPDGYFGIGGSSDDTTSLWDLQTGQLIRRYSGPIAGVYSAAFGPDGKDVVVGFQDGRVELWRVDASLGDLLAWTRAHRYVMELDCEQRELYRLTPGCGITSISATSTPIAAS